LQVEKTRKIIQTVFENHIVKAPGMENIKNIIKNSITPTPGAVMEAAKLLYNAIGDLIIVDIGGATTDIHSVTNGSEAINKILIAPEPLAKRTVEGDLGVYINKDNLIESIGMDRLMNELNISEFNLKDLIKNYTPIPDEKQISLTERLSLEAFNVALKRHSGRLVYFYNSSGKVAYAEGKDLTNVKYIIATGGALTRLPNRLNIIKNGLSQQSNLILSPDKKSKILIDKYYIMASLGVLSKAHPEAALMLMKRSLDID